MSAAWVGAFQNCAYAFLCIVCGNVYLELRNKQTAENWVCAQWKTRICRLSNKAQQINLTYKKHISTLKFRDNKSTKDYKGHALRHCKHFQYGRPGFDSHVRRVFTLKMSVIFYLLHKLADDFLKRPDFFFRFYDQDQSKNNKISGRIFKISSSPSPRGEF